MHVYDRAAPDLAPSETRGGLIPVATCGHTPADSLAVIRVTEDGRVRCFGLESCSAECAAALDFRAPDGTIVSYERLAALLDLCGIRGYVSVADGQPVNRNTT